MVKEGYPDTTQFEPSSKYFDPESSLQDPRWFRVDVKAVESFDPPVTLKALRAQKALTQMLLLQKGSRLSVQPVTESEWNFILQLREAR